MHALVGGKWSLLCGRCMRPSVPVAGADAGQAWEELKRAGWSYYWPDGNRNFTGYAVCPACASAPAGEAKTARRRGRRQR
jgi:hypothetical protein